MKQAASYRITQSVYDKEAQDFSYLEINGEKVLLAGDVALENNKAATIDVSTYTAPVAITPTEGKDGMKKATITLSNIPVASDTVATPVITKSTAISIACDTASATIFYKEDSGVYKEYTVPFSPTEGTTKIYAFAVKAAMLPSATAEYTIE